MQEKQCSFENKMENIELRIKIKKETILYLNVF